MSPGPTATGTQTPAAPAATVAVPARPPHPPERRKAVKDAATLTLAAVLLMLVILGTALVLLQRHRRRLVLGSRRPVGRSGRKVDAWAESARRLHGPGNADDDTVDLDPGDLDPGDLGPDDVDRGPRRGGGAGRTKP